MGTTNDTYIQALHDTRVRRYGIEVTSIMEDYEARARREYRETAHVATPQEVKAGLAIAREIHREITGSGGDGNLPPSIAAWYQAGREAQQKQDSTFCIPGYNVGVILNPDNTLTFQNCTNLSSDMAVSLCSIIYAIDNLLDLTEQSTTSPYDSPMGYGQNAATYAAMQQKKQLSTSEWVGAQFRRLRHR